MADELENQSFTLSDGRRLAFAEYGVPIGIPVFFFHGFPGSRIEGRMWANAAPELEARIISPDRPGFGNSAVQAKRGFTTFARDVAELAAHLKIEKYYVLGASGGGAYALACAYSQPEALLGVGILAGSGPYEDGTAGVMFAQRAVLWCMSWSPALIRPFIKPMIKASQDPDPAVMEKLLLQAFASLPEKDKAFVDDEKERKIMVDVLREAYRQGSDGWSVEAAMITKPWDFKIEDITFPGGITFWYGTEDNHTPVAMGRKIAERLPRPSTFYLYKGETHLTICKHAEELLRTLLKGEKPANAETISVAPL